MKTLEQLGISPAPWNARKVRREEGFTDFEVYDDNGNYVLFDGDAGFANCNLIAAAPELYDTLQSHVEYIDRECIPCGETACELMAAAHNVLAKAAGESEVEK